MNTTFQTMDPSKKYRPYPQIDLPNRSWPNNILTKPPIWLSTDLRDGNQSLIDPMDIDKKVRMFELLVQLGYKEIEVGFPSASQIEFDFVRKLIEENRIPDDVTIQGLTQARTDLINRTVESMLGAKNAIVHVYNATSPLFREVVYNKTPEETIEIAVNGIKDIKAALATLPTDVYAQTNWRLEYSPETFSMTELPFAKQICEAVMDEWGATPDNKVILNLPTTIEVATPNVFADQIEWMHTNLKNRNAAIISVHPHNDRGTGTACAELAILAGADRVEGCLFGNGERTGNVCLVNLAINLWSQGIHPGVDYSNINEVIRIAEECTQLPVGARHPWAGELVFTAFSGSHQDAIKKGLTRQKDRETAANGKTIAWEVPYLPIDPADLGRSYEAVIRVNAQSGKGGMAYLLERDYGLTLPRILQVDVARAVQVLADETGKELSSEQIYEVFCEEFLNKTSPIEYINHTISHHTGVETLRAQLKVNGEAVLIEGNGNGPLSAFVHALNQKLGSKFSVAHYSEHDIHSDQTGEDAQAACYVQVAHADYAPAYGVGIHENIVTASLLAVVSAMNRSGVAQ
ncbi:2-isopropylmalate synthase [Formosimonas limnophila]|uniref:2-isopropylmalate synthase n=1 Tax=Formosimonas limnophila TaxID=1384487 RepID=A0A8J3FYS9_9BURK|nr:2-isopropylmalate synthase [Formosimonas limnophila]GHA68165.1 2-isopropylmalate synthase [Formosimonas limnophila]